MKFKIALQRRGAEMLICLSFESTLTQIPGVEFFDSCKIGNGPQIQSGGREVKPGSSAVELGTFLGLARLHLRRRRGGTLAQSLPGTTSLPVTGD